MIRRFVAIALLFLLCGSSQPPVDDIENSEAAVTSSAEVLRGHLIWGHEVREFTKCGSSETGWIIDNTDGQLRQLAENVSQQPYEKILVEIRAQLGPAPETGFGADYNFSFVATEAKALTDAQGCE